MRKIIVSCALEISIVIDTASDFSVAYTLSRKCVVKRRTRWRRNRRKCLLLLLRSHNPGDFDRINVARRPIGRYLNEGRWRTDMITAPFRWRLQGRSRLVRWVVLLARRQASAEFSTATLTNSRGIHSIVDQKATAACLPACVVSCSLRAS